MPSLHQFVAGFREGDAISQEAALLQRHFRAWGLASEIVCDPRRASLSVRNRVRAPDEIAAALRPDDVALLHLSIGTPINRLFADLRCRRAILYHNVTPPHWFRLFNPAIAADLEEGRRQAAALAHTAELNLADSAYNAAELTQMGYRDVRVLPLAIDLAALEPGAADPVTCRLLDDGRPNVLFVGRVVPNKRLEDLLTVMHYLQRHVCPAARFVQVGSAAGVEAYQALLLARVQQLGLQDTRFLGPVSHAALNACYRTASAFLCLSEHEGFCAPLLEAMAHDVPVLAYAAAAVPETLAGAGICFRDKDPALIAETLGTVIADPALRAAIVERQRRRLDAYRRRDLDAELRALLTPLLAA